jgi:hypothetical protein
MRASGATELAASSSGLMQGDGDVPVHPWCAGHRCSELTPGPRAALQVARVHRRCRMMLRMQLCPFARRGEVAPEPVRPHLRPGLRAAPLDHLVDPVMATGGAWPSRPGHTKDLGTPSHLIRRQVAVLVSVRTVTVRWRAGVNREFG